MFKKKGRAGEARPGKGKLGAVSTSYGGMTRVRFGGFFPRAGKSRSRGRGTPLSCVANMNRLRVGAKGENTVLRPGNPRCQDLLEEILASFRRIANGPPVHGA